MIEEEYLTNLNENGAFTTIFYLGLSTK